MAGPLLRWNDDRLDDLYRRLLDLEPTVHSVGELRVEMRGLKTRLEENTAESKNIARQFEDARVEPLTRHRTLRNGLIIAATSGVVGGGLAVLGAAIGGGH